ncbi:MAG: deoxyribose-phosphate aldolase [Psychrobium sp.]|nr:deoxyribose-phosphate aldolase [Psychrobium sp.]
MTDLERAACYGIQLMDLTSLNSTDTQESVITLCHKAVSAGGHTAAICIYPQFIAIAKKTLAQLNARDIRIASVANFPHGNDSIASAVVDVETAIALGADEVDLVFPYRAFLAGEFHLAQQLIRACKEACTDKAILKVILETGELGTAQNIKKASLLAIGEGADFIKTSTGKVAINATLEAGEQMLQAIKETGGKVGFKAAGGVKDAADVNDYLVMAERLLGSEWICSKNFRFGASSLLDNLLRTLGKSEADVQQLDY